MALVFMLTNSNTSYFRNTGPSYEKEIDQPNTNDGNNSRHICIFAYLHSALFSHLHLIILLSFHRLQTITNATNDKCNVSSNLMHIHLLAVFYCNTNLKSKRVNYYIIPIEIHCCDY